MTNNFLENFRYVWTHSVQIIAKNALEIVKLRSMGSNSDLTKSLDGSKQRFFAFVWMCL